MGTAGASGRSNVNTNPNHATVVGVFDDARMAQAAVEELRRVGLPENQIGVVAGANPS